MVVSMLISFFTNKSIPGQSAVLFWIDLFLLLRILWTRFAYLQSITTCLQQGHLYYGSRTSVQACCLPEGIIIKIEASWSFSMNKLQFILPFSLCFHPRQRQPLFSNSHFILKEPNAAGHILVWCKMRCSACFPRSHFSSLCIKAQLRFQFSGRTSQTLFFKKEIKQEFSSPLKAFSLCEWSFCFSTLFSSWFLECCLWFLLIVFLCFLCYWKMAQCASVIGFLLSLHQPASNLAALTYWFKKAQWKLLLKVSSLWFNCSRGSQKGSRILKRDCIMKCSTFIHVPFLPQSESTNEACTYEHLIEISVEDK